MFLAAMNFIQVSLPFHPILLLLFGFVGVYLLVRLFARFIEVLPG